MPCEVCQRDALPDIVPYMAAERFAVYYAVYDGETPFRLLCDVSTKRFSVYCAVSDGETPCRMRCAEPDGGTLCRMLWDVPTKRLSDCCVMYQRNAFPYIVLCLAAERLSGCCGMYQQGRLAGCDEPSLTAERFAAFYCDSSARACSRAAAVPPSIRATS